MEYSLRRFVKIQFRSGDGAAVPDRGADAPLDQFARLGPQGGAIERSGRCHHHLRPRSPRCPSSADQRASSQPMVVSICTLRRSGYNSLRGCNAPPGPTIRRIGHQAIPRHQQFGMCMGKPPGTEFTLSKPWQQLAVISRSAITAAADRLAGHPALFSGASSARTNWRRSASARPPRTSHGS